MSTSELSVANWLVGWLVGMSCNKSHAIFIKRTTMNHISYDPDGGNAAQCCGTTKLLRMRHISDDDTHGSRKQTMRWMGTHSKELLCWCVNTSLVFHSELTRFQRQLACFFFYFWLVKSNF